MSDNALVYGPRTITKVRQVAIPASLLNSCGIHPGDPVYFQLSAEVPGAILILPTNGPQTEAAAHVDEMEVPGAGI